MSFRFYMLSLKERQNHIKVSSTNILCSESNGSQGWFPLQVKIETKARFLAKRPARGYWRPHKQKIFVLLTFITFINTISKKTFITYKKQEAKFFCSQETRKGLLAATHTKEILLLAFYSVIGYQCKFL